MYKKNTYLASLLPTLVIISLLFGATSTATAFELVKNGRKSCVGNVNATNDSRYGLRNRNSYRTIRLDRIKVFDGNGNVAYDSNTDGFVASMKTILPPHNSTAVSMSALLTAGSGTYATGPGQVEFDWTITGGRMGIPLGMGGKRVVIDTSTNKIIAERPQKCKSIPIGY